MTKQAKNEIPRLRAQLWIDNDSRKWEGVSNTRNQI